MSGYVDRDRVNRLQTAIEFVENAQEYLRTLHDQLIGVDVDTRVAMDQAEERLAVAGTEVGHLLGDGSKALAGCRW